MTLHQAFPRMKRLSILVLLISFVASLAVAPVTAAPEMPSFIVQGTSTPAVAALVEYFGGTVTSQLDLIHGVGASLPSGVVDTGLTRHPGLVNSVDGSRKDRITGWADFVDPSHAPRDPNGHGTHIAGIIANSQVGVDGEWNGVAPGVNLVGVRVLDELGFWTY